MILNDIAIHLEDNSTLVLGVDLTLAFMPENPNTVTTIYETGGAGPLNAFSTGGGTRIYEQPSIQIITRSTSYETARNIQETVFTALDGVNNQAVPSTGAVHYGSIDAVQSPFLISRDSNNRFKVGVNFDVLKSTG